MKSLTDQLASVRRELALRRNVYPKWIKDDRITLANADHELECFVALEASIQKLLWLEEASESWHRNPPKGIAPGRPLTSPTPIAPPAPAGPTGGVDPYIQTGFFQSKYRGD